MTGFRNIYRIIRSVLLSVLIAVATLYILLYILLSMPSVQQRVKNEAESFLSEYLGGDLSIGKLEVFPFNQVVLNDVQLLAPDSVKCLSVTTLGAGIDLYALITKGRVVITYAEVIGLDARISQSEPDKPLNIQFIIDAFKPKDRNKPPAKFDLVLHNIVIRRSNVSYDKEWLPHVSDPSQMDFNHLRINNLRADIALPRISNEDYEVDLRRLSLTERSGFDLSSLSLKAKVTTKDLNVSNIVVKTESSEIRAGDISLAYDGFNDIMPALKRCNNRLTVKADPLYPSDFGAFLPALYRIDGRYKLRCVAQGNADYLDLSTFSLQGNNGRVELDVSSEAHDLADKERFAVKLRQMDLYAESSEILGLVTAFSPLPERVRDGIAAAGAVRLNARGNFGNRDGALEFSIGMPVGNVKGQTSFTVLPENSGSLTADVELTDLALGRITGIPDLGVTSLYANCDLDFGGRNVNGCGSVNCRYIEWQGNMISNISVEGSKHGDVVDCHLKIDDELTDIEGTATADLGSAQRLDAEVVIGRFLPQHLGLSGNSGINGISGIAKVDITGFSPDTFTGMISLQDLLVSRSDKDDLRLNNFTLTSRWDEEDADARKITFDSEYLSGEIYASSPLSKLPADIMTMAHNSLPSWIPATSYAPSSQGVVDFSLTLKNDNNLSELLALPVKLLVDIPVKGRLDMASGDVTFDADIPYLQQGKDKLIRDTHIALSRTGVDNDISLKVSSVMPAKKSDVRLSVDLTAQRDEISSLVGWAFDTKEANRGEIAMNAQTIPGLPGDPPSAYKLRLRPAKFAVNDTTWNVGEGELSYSDKRLEANGIRIWNDRQLVSIHGSASASDADTMFVKLRDINLNYIFETLNINYVTFGGRATGNAYCTSLFTKAPKASTDGLFVKNLSYNGGVLGDAELTSHWDQKEKMVAIRADINENGRPDAVVDGGVWIGADSLSFDISADKVDIAFLQPFMSAFTSKVSGRASGKAKLFGTFKDIDLAGRLFADTISMKVDYTNVTYCGSDSVIIDPGRIVIPAFRLHDKYGNSGILSGTVTHDYFHDPSFDFRLRNARNLLCYDTDSKINPVWYGTIFGSGSGSIIGHPGIVRIDIDMTTARNSTFTFVLSDTEAAEDYKFLTFTDRRKEALEVVEETGEVDFVKMFRKKVEQQTGPPSDFILDVRATITPEAKMVLVMDPVSDDRIVARGSGALQLGYGSDTERLTMFGKYVLDEGNYNFTLQDIILKDFKIRQGSQISFNGDPLRAVLDINAAYRVNTNLADLDKSFASDRELNRTNVPVDAILYVKGDIEDPEITFGLELPTLSQDVARKVMSIISTDDMMSRQIIYLLALNRFYTPEYMGASGNGGEWASVASSTLSSQLTNMLGHLTDKFTIAPSLRSDKGDFSDMEVDLALSSRLLNNRLLLNGNFGYRDRSTSNTTFIGDFDIEYLLNRSGNLRLKAYNHFNDQNYYLKSALTTQGIGIVYKRDFDNPFSFLRRKRRGNAQENTEKQTEDKKEGKDSVSGTDVSNH